MINIKESYITNVICHKFSTNKKKSFVSSVEVNDNEYDHEVLKELFLNPFSRQKKQFAFFHEVSLDYNVIYQLSLKIYEQDSAYVDTSIDIFNHLNSVSSSPTIKDGDVFVVKFNDILLDEEYCEALGVYKIERKQSFIEISQSKNAQISLSMREGLSTKYFDKGALIIYTKQKPIVYIKDSSKDSKFWKDDFLKVKPFGDSFNKTEAVQQLFHSFINEHLVEKKAMSKLDMADLLKRCDEMLKNEDTVSTGKITENLFEDADVKKDFENYKRTFEEKAELKLEGDFSIDNKALSNKKTLQRILLDDVADIRIMRTGDFIERGYDDKKGLNYYKFYFSNEK